MAEKMPERVYVSPEFNAPLIQGAGLNPLRLRDRASAFIEPHDSLVPYHREDTCAERVKKLRADIVQRIKDNETAHRNAIALGYHTTSAGALASVVSFREVLALLDSLSPEKEGEQK